jgi:CBS domain-containing protein
MQRKWRQFNRIANPARVLEFRFVGIFYFETGRNGRIVFNLMEIAGSVSAILADKGSAVWSIAPASTVFDAIHLMADKNVGALPVVENDRLVGIISERDYTRKVILKGKSSKETLVREIMTKDPLTAHPGDSVGECMEVMTEKRVRHLPVIEGERIVGLISIGDLVRRIISAQNATIDNLESYITGSYPV